MKKASRSPFPVFLASAALASVLFVSACEGGGGDDGDPIEEEGPASASTSSSSSSASNYSNCTGTWKGRSSSSQASTTLHLSDSSGSISGSLKWPADTRSVSGSRSGSSVVLYVEGGDVWHLTWNGSNRLSGRGYKPEGGSYACSFSLQ